MTVGDAMPLLVIALGAFTIPLVSSRLGIPAAVGEIAFGAALGPYALGFIETGPALEFLSELGFAFLMFLAGLELEFSEIERQGTKRVAATLLFSFALFPLAWLASVALGVGPFVMVAFGAVSVGVLLASLNESGAGRSRLGQTIILMGSFGEFFTIVALTLVGFAYKHGPGAAMALEMGKLALILVAAYGLMVILRTLIWWFPGAFARVVRTRDPSEIGVRAGMALMMVFVVFAALMGVKPILGAFVAGALFSFVFREKGILETKMSSLGFGFFVPVFFISVGASFDLGKLTDARVLPTAAIIMGVSLLTKTLVSLPFIPRFGVKGAMSLALLLSTPLTLLVVIAKIGQAVGAVDEVTASALVLVAMGSSIVFPAVYRFMAKRAPDLHGGVE